MKNLNICIDIDGTITDPYFWIEKASEHFGKDIKPNQFTEYEFHKVLNVTPEEYNLFYEETKFLFHSKERLQLNAKEVINKFYEANNIYFVTARDKSLEMITASYLKNYDIKFDGLYVLGTPYKAKQAKKLKCDIFIEDSLSNALNLSEAGFKVLLIDAPYNQSELNHNIQRVYNWFDVLYEINNMIITNKAV